MTELFIRLRTRLAAGSRRGVASHRRKGRTPFLAMGTSLRAITSQPADAPEGFTRRISDSWDSSDLETLPEHLRPRRGETLDLILRQKVYLLQARRGYRANVDSHILPLFASKAFMHTGRNGNLKKPRVLDLGAGNGLASILFARAHPPQELCLVELQAQLADRASRNLQLNDVYGTVIQHDLQGGNLPSDLCNRFDVVLINPPFYPPGGRQPPRRREKLLAHVESSATIFDFLQAARKACDQANPDAFIALIYDTTELPRLQKAVRGNHLVPCMSREMLHTPEEEPSRVIMQMKPSRSELKSRNSEKSNTVRVDDIDVLRDGLLTPAVLPLVLHESRVLQSRYTHEIESFLSALPLPTLRIGRLRDVH